MPPSAPRTTSRSRRAAAVVGEGRVTAHTRSSRGGRRTCVTLTLHAHTVDEVIATYERLHALEALLLIL